MEIPGSGNAMGLAENAQLGADRTRLRALADGAAGSNDRAGLEKAAQEFESVFLNQLMQAMRRTVPENELFNSQGATKLYRQMHDQEIAKALATGRSGMGIADLIVQQFAGNVEPAAAPTAPAAREPAGPPVPSPLRVQPERQGPPPPPPAVAAARYRALEETAARVDPLGDLRQLAGRESAAAADTLARYEADLTGASRAASVPPALLLAVVMEESGGDAAARSPKGAQGLMQLMPGTASELGVTDPGDPGQNLHGGAKYLGRMLERYEGRLDLALAAYNAGPGTVDRAGRQVPDYPETRRYVQKVMARYERLGGGTNLALSE